MTRSNKSKAFVIVPCCNAHGKFYYKCEDYPHITANIDNAKHYSTDEEALEAMSDGDIGVHKIVYDNKQKKWYLLPQSAISKNAEK